MADFIISSVLSLPSSSSPKPPFMAFPIPTPPPLNNVVADYQKKETDVAEEFYRDAATKGKGTYSAHTNSVNYLGVEASPTVIMDKL